MTRLGWWLRIVGVFYLLQFVMMVFVRAPIRAMGHEDALALAATGDRTARFLIDTWVIFGLEVGGIGAALIVASRMPSQARLLVWMIVAIELARGIAADVYILARGGSLTVALTWIVIHSVVIATGVQVLRSDRSALSA